MSWHVDQAAVDTLAVELGLRKTVSVVQSHFEQPYIQGKQTTGPDGHVILLKRDLPVEVANQTLCHEIRHCYQQEMLGPEADAVYALFLMLAGYDGHPLEQDADEWAAKTAPTVQLIRARQE